MYCNRSHNLHMSRQRPKPLSWALLVVWLMVATGAMHAGHVVVHHGGHVGAVASTSSATDHAPGAARSDSPHPHKPEDSTPAPDEQCKLCQLVRSLNAHTLDLYAAELPALEPSARTIAHEQNPWSPTASLPFSPRGPPIARCD
jgi:hypothetical protein